MSSSSDTSLTFWAWQLEETLACFIYILDSSLQVHPNFDLVSSLLALFEARKVAQMTTEMIECYQLRISTCRLTEVFITE